MKILRAIFNRVELGLRIVAKLLLLVPLLLAMVWVSFAVDVSGLFHTVEYEQAIVDALLEGSDLTGYDQMAERRVNALYAETVEEAPATLALGSSRVLQYGADMAGTTFYNGGLSGADFYDILGTFYLFDRAEKLPENLVISLDAWLFNSNADAYNIESDKELYDEFLSLRLGYETAYREPAVDYTRYTALFDPAYFQASVTHWLKNTGEATSATPNTVNGDLYSQPTNVKLHDGSVLYNEAFRNADRETVEALAREQAGTFVRMDNFHTLDPDLIEVFDAFIQYALGEGVNVIFLLVPYHPLVYNYATENAEQFTGFFISESWYTQYAMANNIPLYGSYNPFVAGATEADFYDGLHITAEGLARILPSIAKITLEQKSGHAGSPWLWGETRVSYETAERITIERYEIEAPHILIRGEDFDMDGTACYMLLRYESEVPGATLLAQYAVSQDEGITYRLATDIGYWVVDERFTG